MKHKLLILIASMMLLAAGLTAQRRTDALDRGVVAIKVGGGVYVNWRILAEEYYDVTYNVYRDGTKLNATPLAVSNYTDPSGTTSSHYTVRAVVRGVEQADSRAASVWSQSYLEVPMNHGSLKSTYVPNDACCADVDGDGELEILLKFDNSSWAGTSYQKAGYQGEYHIMEVYKLDGTRLWWIDLGPNMADFQNNEQNIVAYDWDGDGKAEAVMRASDGTTIHMADGTTQVIGDASKNYLTATSSGQWFVHEGSEFLVYMNGETGKPYQVIDYPLKRLESGETDLSKAWGDGYGHRSTKHFFGAPYLDGRKPSIFLARGIYTRHKMVALDVDPSTHKLTTRWSWTCNDSSSPWYGNGYHNYGIADVDMDGRDEICFGSMVIDDNGKGLSTTGLGHGDAQHHGDFDPYRHGLEIYACNEDLPDNNYRDGTTSKIYYRHTSGNDDGRAICGNFSNDFPGAMGYSGHDSPISCVVNDHVPGLVSTGVTLNMNIYWDGDLCSESFNGSATRNSAGVIYKYGNSSPIATLTGSFTNNDTKATPCYQGDILGDWREEVIMRTANNNIRIYTTTTPTPWRNYTLWHDHQYRQAMVWQMCGYNQPPHVSYFLGELEGITVAPPPLTMTGRTEVAAGGTISSAHNDQHVLVAPSGSASITVADGASPYIVTFNSPSWVQGKNSNSTTNPDIDYTYYTLTVGGGAFTGATRLVKQGDGKLRLPAVVETYTGPTDVWNGTLQFDGTLQASRLWLNRHTTLISDGGKFQKGIQADYNATIIPGSDGGIGSITTDSLILGFGSRVKIDVSGTSADQINAAVLSVERKDWQYGPTYNTPVFEFHGTPAEGRILLGEVGKIEGNLDDIVIDGFTDYRKSLVCESGKLYIDVKQYEVQSLVWTGAESGVWNLDNAINFVTAGTTTDQVFTPRSSVAFDDDAATTEITVDGNLLPGALVFDNATKDYTLSGDSLVGNPSLTKRGAGRLTITSNNHIGSTAIEGGTLAVATLANTIGQDYGALGGVSSPIGLTNGGTLAVTQTATAAQPITITGSGTINVPSGASLTLSQSLRSSGKPAVRKTGTGTLSLAGAQTLSSFTIEDGTVNIPVVMSGSPFGDTLRFEGGSVVSPHSYSTSEWGTSSNVWVVPEGKTGTFSCNTRWFYKEKLLGSGTFTFIHARAYSAPRATLQGDWSAFTGTVVAKVSGTTDFVFNNTAGLPNATLNIPDASTIVMLGGNNVNTTGTFRIGALTGSGQLSPGASSSNLYEVGSLNKDFSFGGKINATLRKVGTGSMTLTGNTGSSPITIAGGALVVSNLSSTKTTTTGTSTLTIDDGARLEGRYYVGNNTVNVKSGGMVKPGLYGTGGLTFAGSLLLRDGSVVELQINKTRSVDNYVYVSGTMFRIEGKVRVILGNNYTPTIGDEFTLLKAAGTMNVLATASVELPELPAGMKWDDSDFLTAQSKLRIVADESAIASIASDAPATVVVYAAGGQQVGELTTTLGRVTTAVSQSDLPRGIYILRISSVDGVTTRKFVKR